MKNRKRSYVQSARHEKMEQTRSRIVDAVMALHQEVGPAQTTIAAIAKRAGVQRLTVYRHFPDESDLLAACSGRYAELNPPPDAAAWDTGQAPIDYAREGLLSLYAYFSRTEAMLAKVYRDAPEVPALATIMDRFDAYLSQLADTLADRFSAAKQASDCRLALRHLVRFETWRSLETEGAANERKVELALKWLRASQT